MGWDICGAIECREQTGQEAVWRYAADLYPLYEGRNYDSFGCLFGFKNHANFRPIAEGRGLPPDISSEVRKDFERFRGEGSGMSWVSWAEIKAIDWEEEGEQADSRIHRYERNEQGELVFTGKAVWDREFEELVNSQQIETEAGTMASMLGAILGAKPAMPEGQQWEKGNVVYRSEKLKRKDACDDWGGVFNAMEQYAATYGDDGVRLVVWFIF